MTARSLGIVPPEYRFSRIQELILGVNFACWLGVKDIDKNGKTTGWLNELAFTPVDANPDADADEWSGDIGCGVKYFSRCSYKACFQGWYYTKPKAHAI